MLRELAEGLPAGARLAVVSRQPVAAGRAGRGQCASPTGCATRAARASPRWACPVGAAPSDAGVFVIDGDGVLRLAYRTSSTEEWIPAAFVLSRVRRLLPAEPDVRVLRTQLGAADAPVLPGSDPA